MDPPKNFIVRGPYRYVRNPILIGVNFILFSEYLILNSLIILIATIPPVCSLGSFGIPVLSPRFFIVIPGFSLLVIFTVSYRLSKAIAKQSKPEPRFALDAGPIAVTSLIFFNIC